MASVLALTVPLFLIIALGALLRRGGVLTETGIHALNRIVYAVALPAIIFSSFARIDWGESSVRTTLIANMAILAVFALGVLVLLALLRVDRSLRGSLAACAIVGNTVYLGFPIGTQFLGAAHAPVFFAAATPHLVLGIAFSVLIIEYYSLGVHDPRRFFLDFFRNPLIIALALGMVFGTLRLAEGAFGGVLRPVDMLAATASPLALLTLGAFMVGKFSLTHVRETVLVLVLKLGALPLAVAGASVLFGFGGPSFSASIIAAAMPTAVTVFSVADRYRSGTALVANAILLSTVIGFISISATLGFLASS